MQTSHGCDHAQAQTVARRMPTGLGAVQAAEHRFALGFRNAGAVITHADTRALWPRGHVHLNPAAIRGKLDGVVEQVAHRIEQQLRIATQHSRRRRWTECQGHAALFGQRLEKLGSVGANTIQIDLGKVAAPGAVFDLRDP